MTVAAFIYARSDSSRLPNKIFKLFGKKTLLEIVVDRVRQCKVDEVVLLTSDRKLDDELTRFAKTLSLNVFRGSAFDLVDRTSQAIKDYQYKKFIRINGDSPFISPSLVNFTLDQNADAVLKSNLLCRRFPYGVSVEILDSAWYLSMSHECLPSEKEHVTKHLYRMPLNAQRVSITQDKNWSSERLTIDTLEDYKRLQPILEKDHSLEYWTALNKLKPKYEANILNA